MVRHDRSHRTMLHNVSRIAVVIVVGASTVPLGCTREISTTSDPSISSATTTGPSSSGALETPSTSTSTTSTTTTSTTTTSTSSTSTTTTTSTITSTSSTTSAPASTSTTSPVPIAGAGTTSYGLPVADIGLAGWGDTHSGYPATDIFVGCGAELVSPVNGTILEVRRVDAYDPAVDNPATRGGRSVSILGDDGVRYYLAHFDVIVEPLAAGDRVAIGRRLGTMGDTGRASACHLHFSISPLCPGKEWSVRRGVIWPYPYLNAWSNGDQASPVDEVRAWSVANPDACADAMADPFAADA